MIEMRLPDYEVIIHIQYNSFGKKLEDQILLETKSYKLDESTEYQGRKDYHWSFKTWEEAVLAGNILKKYCQNSNLLLLKVKTNKTDEKPIIHKG